MSTAVQVSTEQERRASQEAVRTHIRGGFLAAGRELLRIRPTIPHGEWKAHCEECGLTVGAAGHLMRASKAVDDGLVPPDLSLRGTLKAISDTRDDEPQIANAVSDLDETEADEPVQSTFDPFAGNDDPEIPVDVLERIDACLKDDSYPDAEYAKMRGNRRNVLAGVMSPETFLERWERKPPAPETPAAPVVVTPVEDAPDPAPEPTERAEVRPAEPRVSKAQQERLELEAALAEANREKQMLLFEKEDLEQQVKVAEDKLAQHVGEASNVGGGIAGAELRKLQAEKRTWQGRAWEWQQKYEDERRLAAALKRQLKQYTG